jgi:iron complex outermembrane recepter protein
LFQPIKQALDFRRVSCRVSGRWPISTLAAACAYVAVLPAPVRAQPEAVSPPAVIVRVEPVFPLSALGDRKKATALVEIVVDESGHVTDASTVSSAGEALDSAARDAIRQWVFRPALQAGRPVASRIRVALDFRAPGEIPAAPGTPVPAAPAPAAPPSAATPAVPPAPEKIEEVTVRGRRRPPSRGASDFHIEVGALAAVPRQNASELLKLAPGILLTNEGGEGHAEQVFLRGFDAREGQDIEFTVGGVPINESGNLHGNGYADTHFIIPEVVESLRVLEGPYDPHQGNYAVAGSAEYELGLAERGVSARYLTGSWGTERLLLLWGPGGESRHTFGAAEVSRSDGYGQNRDSERAAALTQYEGRLGARGSFRLLGTGYATTYHTAGVIREDDYAAGRKGFFDTYDHGQGGDASRFSVSADLEVRADATTFAQQVFGIVRGMRLRENFTGFLLDVQEPLQRLHVQRGDLLDLDTDEVTVGARGSARIRSVVRGLLQELELGYFARGDKLAGSQQRLEAATGFPYRTENNIDAKLSDIAVYVDADVHPFPRLSLRGGVRADAFTFDIDDLCAVHTVPHPNPAIPPGDGSCLDQADLGRHREPNQRASTGTVAVLPRGSVLVGPVAGVSATVSYGRGIRSVDPIYITQDIKTPFASAVAYDAGLSYNLTLDRLFLLARAGVFRTHVDRDLIFSESAGRNVLGLGTTRTGLIGALRATGRFFDQAMNVTVVRSTFDDTGLLVAYVPDLVVRSDSALYWEHALRPGGRPVRGSLGVGVTYVGRRALPFGERSQVIFTVDADARLRWHGIEVGVAATNLFDRRYRLGEFNFASDFRQVPDATPTLVPVRQFTAGAPRGLFFTFGLSLGGP